MARILLITNLFPPLIGGPAVFIDRLAHRLSRAGHRVTVVCSGEKPSESYDSARPFRVVRVSLRNRYLYEVLVRLALAWQLLLHRHVLVNGLADYVAPIARLLRRRYVLKVVGDAVWERERNAGGMTLGFDEFQANRDVTGKLAGPAATQRRSLQQASRIVTPSRYMTGVVQNWGYVPPAQVTTIENGVPLEDFAGHAPSARAEGQALDVLYVGRLANWKGVETLLLALPGVDNIRLTIIGDGPEKPMLCGLARQLGLDGVVVFAGKMEQPALHARMKAAHVLALPSNYEGMSHTLLEAGAAGLARIVSDIGGNAEIIDDGRDGMLLPYGDVAAWRAALMLLRDNEAERWKLADGGQRRTAQYDFSAGVELCARAVLEES